MTYAKKDLEARLGPFDPPYETGAEARIGQLLRKHDVPFLYRQPTTLYNQGSYVTWNPAFTLPGYNDLVIEYAQGQDRHQYMQEARDRQQVYRANGVPALFLYPADLTGPGWSKRVLDRIVEDGYAAGRYSPRSSYAGRS